MRRHKAKRAIYIRTFCAFLATYLALMAGFTIVLVDREKEVMSLAFRTTALHVNDIVEGILQDYLDDQNRLTDLAGVKKELAEKSPMFRLGGTELALFTEDYDLIFNTSGISGRWICSYEKYREGNTSYPGQGYLNLEEWFPEREMTELENYLYANPKAEKEGDFYRYSVELEGFWVDDEMIIPDTIRVTPMYARTFDKNGNVESGSGGDSIPKIYISGYQDTKGLPYFEHGGISVNYGYRSSEKQLELLNMVLDQEKLKKAVETYFEQQISSERVNLFTYRYYTLQPYQNTVNSIFDQYYSTFWTVLTREVDLWDKCADTLIFVWVSCLIAFVSVAFILSTQTYKTYKKREELERFRQETTNALAHDLKTPLSIISGYAQNLLENIHTDKRLHYAGGIQANVNRMDKIIREMLEFSRLESDSLPLESKELSLAEVSGEIIRRYRQVCAEKFITVQLAGDAVLKGDPALFDRVLNNFFVNALDNTPDRGTIRIQITDNKLEFYNSGSHIPEDKLDEIWQPYKKVDTSRGNSKGTGLGLAIAQSIFELYHYSYGAKNSNDGVVFWFKFA